MGEEEDDHVILEGDDGELEVSSVSPLLASGRSQEVNRSSSLLSK